MENLYGKTLSDLESLAGAEGWPRYSAAQLAGWMYPKGVSSFAEMTNLPRAVREILQTRFQILKQRPESSVIAEDGTRKYLFRFHDRLVETAVIPDRERKTLCLSTQSGCRMGCLFCATGAQGFAGSLSSGEMLSQWTGIDEATQINNIVIMGMGEPLDNLENLLRTLEILTSPWGFGLSAGRITVSTVGIPDKLIQLLEQTKVNIALSLHHPFPEGRAEILPAERKWPVAETLRILKTNPRARERKLTIEYLLLSGVNDSPRHAAELNRILNGIKAKVNLIPWNPSGNLPFSTPDADAQERFRQLLKEKGLTVTIRRSRGGEINAACGLLSTVRDCPKDLP